ncbi:MAG: ankyrin repeat domain-containing protein [Planctomycetota bacterium]
MKLLTTSITILLLLTFFTDNPTFAQKTKKPLNVAVAAGDIDQVKSEINAGADVNWKDSRTGWTLLHIAINKGYTEITQFLIDKGADVNARDNRGRRPVHLAVEKGQKSIVEKLIAKGADLNAIDSRSDNALTLAKKKNLKEIEDLLIKNGAKEPDLSLLQGDRLYSVPGGQQGINSYTGPTGRNQSRGRNMNTGQTTAEVDILADPNEIKTRIKKFDGLDKELKVVADKSQNELRQWQQTRYDNRSTLARAVDKQFEDEMKYVRKLAVEESAKKTTEAIDNLLSGRRKRSLKVNRELMLQKRELKQAQSMQTRTRGRTTGRSTRGQGQYSQRGQSYGTGATSQQYGRGTDTMARGGIPANPGRPPEQLDQQTQEQIRLWVQATPDKKLELARTIHPQIRAEITFIRTIAVEEKAKKTTAAIDGLLLARKERFDGLVVKMEQEQLKLQQAQGMYNRAGEQGQLPQQGGRYQARTRRGAGTQQGDLQQQNNQQGTRYRRR